VYSLGASAEFKPELHVGAGVTSSESGGANKTPSDIGVSPSSLNERTMDPAEVESRANAHAVEEAAKSGPTPVLYNPGHAAPAAPVLQAKPEPYLVVTGVIPQTETTSTVPSEQNKPLPPPPPAQGNGKVQGEHTDLGWNDHVDRVPEPLVKGMSNEDMCTLIRRFDKVAAVLFVVLQRCSLTGYLASLLCQSDPTACPRPTQPQYSRRG
jgi:hypothetical protein